MSLRLRRTKLHIKKKKEETDMEEERKLGKVLATVFALFLCLVMLVTTVIPDRSYAASISKKKVTVYVGNTTTLSVKGTKKNRKMEEQQ